MPDWVNDPADWEALLSALIIVLGIIGWLIRAEVRNNSTTTDATAAQMIPDHGLSLRDAIDRTEARLEADRKDMLAAIAEVHADVKATRGDLACHITWHLDKES